MDVARVDVSVPGAADRGTVVDLLSRQLHEHGIRIAAEALGAAVDGVFADERRGFFLVARAGGAIAGVAYVSFTWALEHGGKSAWLEELYVVPERRGGGLGTQILRAALDEAKRRGAAAVDLEVDSGHADAERLYERHGFRRHSRTRWVRPLR